MSTESIDRLVNQQSARRSLWQKTLDYVASLKISVEPLMLVLAACNTARGIVTPELSEHKMERTYPLPYNMTSHEASKFYNKKMVEWDNNFTYVNLPIACIVGIIYGGYSDVYGRKYPLLIGIVSVLIENAMKMLIWAPSTDLSLTWYYPTAAVSGLLGDFLLTMSCINAYVTDNFEDKHQLSVRMIVVSIIFSLGSFISSRITVVVIKHLSHLAVLGVAEGGYLLSIIIGLFTLKNIKPRKPKVLLEQQEVESTTSPIGLIKLSFYSIYDAGKIFLVSRDGHRRLFLYLCFFANFLDQFVFGEEKGLIGTYTRLPPFQWSSTEYANYKGWRPIVQIIGMFVGMILLKNMLKLRDTLIICLAIGSMGICVLIIGLAQKTWEIYASLAPGSLHGLLNPLTYSFMSCLVEPDEIGKAFAISSIAQKLAGLADTAILQNIYIATVDWYQGFIWLLMASISFVAVAVYAVVHVVAKRENIGI